MEDLNINTLWKEVRGWTDEERSHLLCFLFGYCREQVRFKEGVQEYMNNLKKEKAETHKEGGEDGAS